MPNYFYIDADGQKHGPIDDNRLRELVTQKIIIPETSLETDSGHKGLAGQIPGLFTVTPSPFAQSPASNVFCTNCGNSVTANAVACMSCGAKPTGHKSFCHSCGVAVNPQQIVCIKCGAALGKSTQGSVSINGNESNTGAMWMHLTWPFFPLVTLIIWAVIKDKNPQANIHGKNILNAFFTAIINNLIVPICCIPLIFISYALFERGFDNDVSIAIGIGAGLLCVVGFLVALYILTIRPIITAIVNGIAAEKGEVKPYKWAFRFIKT